MSPVCNGTHVVVENIGKARADAFAVRIEAAGNVSTQTVRISGLAAGASTKIAAQSVCETPRPVKVDFLKEVTQGNEANNDIRSFPGKICWQRHQFMGRAASLEPPAPTGHAEFALSMVDA